MKSVRAVLDTNVIISALLFGGVPKKVLSLVLTGHIDWLISPFLIKEFGGVLRLKFPDREKEILRTLDEFSNFWELIETPVVPRVSVVLADPDDDHLIECALEGAADCIVSGDKQLLAIQKYRGVIILNSAQFLRKYVF